MFPPTLTRRLFWLTEALLLLGSVAVAVRVSRADEWHPLALVGLLLALATSRVVTAMLFGIEPMDARAYAGVLVLAMPFVLLAAIAPALRAARVDPMIALREP